MCKLTSYNHIIKFTSKILILLGTDPLIQGQLRLILRAKLLTLAHGIFRLFWHRRDFYRLLLTLLDKCLGLNLIWLLHGLIIILLHLKRLAIVIFDAVVIFLNRFLFQLFLYTKKIIYHSFHVTTHLAFFIDNLVLDEQFQSL
jgi:hypothetical protein